MGATGCHREKGIKDIDFWRGEFRGDGGREVLACASTMQAAYLAYRDENGNVLAIVCPQHWTRDYFNFTFRTDDETMGPIYTDCPARILALLTPLDKFTPPLGESERKWAGEWRAACQAKLAAKASRPKLEKGMLVTFPTPLTFRNGAAMRALFVEDPKSLILTDGCGGRYRIRRENLDGATIGPAPAAQFAEGQAVIVGDKDTGRRDAKAWAKQLNWPTGETVTIAEAKLYLDVGYVYWTTGSTGDNGQRAFYESELRAA